MTGSTQICLIFIVSAPFGFVWAGYALSQDELVRMLSIPYCHLNLLGSSLQIGSQSSQRTILLCVTKTKHSNKQSHKYV
uniref:Putative secreted protein n=1 Tax=Rhipicephalus microplus TaxID=6941 RepID=A0A6M2DCC4_RHIMP